jgi:ABC-type methionine transport system ATPase subunit
MWFGCCFRRKVGLIFQHYNFVILIYKQGEVGVLGG